MRGFTSPARSVSILLAAFFILIPDLSSGEYSGAGSLHTSGRFGSRLAAAARCAALLDEGRNEAAGDFLERLIEEDPCRIEAAGAFVERYVRQCRFDSAAVFLERSAAAEAGGGCASLALFVRGARRREKRDFEGAAGLFGEGAAAALEAADTLSAVVFMKHRARSLLDARKGRDIFGIVKTARVFLSGMGVTGASFLVRLETEFAGFEAEARNQTDDLPAADSLYNAVFEMADAHGYREMRAYCLNGLGRVREKQQRGAEAADYYRRALAEERILGATLRIAAILNNLGQAETKMGDLEAAELHLEESRGLALSCGADWLLGYIFYGLGGIAETEGERRNALELFGRSLERHEAAGNLWGGLGARLRLGYNLTMLGDYADAVRRYEHCRQAYERMGSLYGLSWTLAGLALASHNLGDLPAAERYYLRAHEVREKLGDRRGMAWCLNSLGMVYDLQGRYREALAREHRAMAIYEEIGDRSGIGSAHFSIGSVYFYLGNFTKSISHYEQALAIARELGDDDLLRRVMSGMGSVYTAGGRADLAGDFYRECLEIARGARDRDHLAWAINNLASFHIQHGKLTRARGLLDESADLLGDEAPAHIRARMLYLRGMTDIPVDEAVADVAGALALAQENGLQELVWKSLTRLGELRRLKGDDAGAGEAFKEAIGSVESLRRGAGLDELQRHMLRPAIVPYERMVSLLLEPGRHTGAVREAFLYTERARAQVFAALMRDAAKRTGGGSGGIHDEEREIISRLSYLQGRLQDGSLTEERRGKLLERVAAVEDDFTRLRVRMANRDEQYTVALYPAGDVQEDIFSTLGTSERLLSYFLGNESSYLFSVASDSISVYALPPRGAIEEKAGRFLALIRQVQDDCPDNAAMHSAQATLPPGVLRSAERELFDLLVRPALTGLEGGTLVIVPDGLLGHLPFALLRTERGHLIEEHEMFFAPSLRSLAILRKRADPGGGPKRRHACDIITVGADGKSGRSPQRVYPFTDIPVTALPHAAKEAGAVAGLFASSRVLTGPEAGEKSFKACPLGEAGIIHIASHTYVDNEDVRRSFIVLNPGGDPRKTPSAGHNPAGDSTTVIASTGDTEDGILQWHEITGLRLDASLVTLSGCKSAGGVLAYGEGITGLTQAFLYAGARCVLASQMDIPDLFAGRFMRAFYGHVRTGMTAAAALRTTQLESFGWDEAGEAGYGATFVLVGDGGIVYDGLK